MDVPIKGLEHHVINEKGEVTNLKTGRKLTPSLFKIGYYVYTLYEHNKPHKMYMHRLLAEAFIPNPENKPQINHIDGNKQNNSLDNLEWVTCQQNQMHAVSTELRTYKRACDKDVCEEALNRFFYLHESLTEIAKKFKVGLTQLDIFVNEYIDVNGCREAYEKELKYQKDIRAVKNGLKKRKIMDLVMCNKITGKEIKHFSSVTEAKNYLNCSSCGPITNVLCGRQKSAYGYFWKYGDQTSTTIPKGSTSQVTGDGSGEYPEKGKDIV